MDREQINKQWPPIFADTLRGVGGYTIDTRRMQDGVRVGARKFVVTKGEAEGYASEIRRQVEKEGHQPVARAVVKTAEERLKPFGKSVSDAINFYVSHLEKTSKGGVLLSDAVRQWLLVKEAMMDCGDLQPRSYESIEYRIGLLKAHFPDAKLNEISTDKLEPFCRSTKYASRTRANVKAVVSEFFLWCKRSKKWIDENPCEVIEIKVKDKEVEILTAAECLKLAKAGKECAWASDFYPYVMFSMFCGLRPSEMQALEWKDVHFDTKEIRVNSDQIRYVPMSDGLVKLLKPYKKAGLVVDRENYRKRWDAVRGKAELVPYPFDGMRHSFASYWLSLHGDRPRLAEIMGNSVEMIKRHYRRAIPRNDAVKFWAILEN